jgi:hypothetical protein
MIRDAKPEDSGPLKTYPIGDSEGQVGLHATFFICSSHSRQSPLRVRFWYALVRNNTNTD